MILLYTLETFNLINFNNLIKWLNGNKLVHIGLRITLSTTY